MVRRIVLVSIATAMFLVAALFLLPFVLPAETLKQQVESQIESNTGWRVRFDGPVEISVFPKLRLVADDVSVSPPNHDEILTAGQARFAVGVSSLLGGNVAIDEIAFRNTDVNIELNQDGNPVWAETSSAVETGTETATQADDAGKNSFAVQLFKTLSVQRFGIENANISYGKVGEQPAKISNLTLMASLPSYSGALNIDGEALLNNDPISISGTIDQFQTLIENTRSPINLSATYKTATLQLAGAFSGAQDTIFTGKIDLSADDIAPVLGDDRINPGQLSVVGNLVARKKEVALTLERGVFYGSTITGDVNINTAGARPVILGTLALNRLDLNQIRKDLEAGLSNTQASQSQSKVEEQEPDLSALQSFDADVGFSIGSILVEDQEVTNFSTRLVVNDGLANITISNLETIGGNASAAVNIDSRTKPATLLGQASASGFQIKTLLDLADQSTVKPTPDGILGANIAFGFRGLTTKNILASANARGSIELSNGTINNLGLSNAFNDPAADRAQNVNVTASINGITEPLTVAGRALWRGEAIRFNAATSLLALMNNEPADTTAGISFSMLDATYKGAITATGTTSGRVTAKGNSARNLAKWAGTDLPPGDGFKAFDISTDFNTNPTALTFQNLSLSLDDIRGNGEATIGLGDIPNIRGTFNFNALNVDPYIGTTSSGSGGNGSAAPSTSGWSNEPIDFSFVRAANIDLTANVDSLQVQGIKAGPLSLKTTMQGGVLNANLSRMGFYGGTGNATVSLDATATPTLKTKLNVSGVNAFPFLKDAAEFERIEGTLALNLDLTTSGTTEATLISALNGNADFNFANGAIRGINIAKSMRALTSGALSGWNNVPTEKTDFSEFKANFNIVNGVAANDNLVLVGPLVRVGGSGTVSLPPQTLKYRVDPKVVASLQGQGGNQDLKGFGVPIIIDGPWSKPRIYPDIAGFLQNPQAGLEQLKQLGGGFSEIASGNVGNILGQIGGVTSGNSSVTENIGNAIQERTGVNVGNIIQGGDLNAGSGAEAAAGIIGGLLGGNRNNQPQQAALPQSTNGIPVPRQKPQTTATTRQAPAAQAVENVIQQIVRPQNESQGQQPNTQQLIEQGLGSIFGRGN